ncbi:MAG: excinuclease ABC subunit A, partial [Planctomycetaceae bacterium]|nr:excinuclease ABC subunit A [Planctomycetaceae bacterium]
GEIVNLSDDLGLKKHFKHTIEVVVDRLVAGKGTRTRLAEAIEQATRLSGGTLLVSTETGVQNPEQATADNSATSRNAQLYSTRYACPDCGISYEPPSPQLFSFNSPLGMCPDCTGLGQRHEFLLEQIIADETKSIWKGALHLLGAFRKVGRWRRHIYQGAARTIEQETGLPEDSFLKTPWKDLPEAARELWLHGLGDRHITFAWRHRGGVWKHGGNWVGFLPELLDEYIKARNPMRRRQLEKFMATVTCSSCEGTRLNRQARNVRIASHVDGRRSVESGDDSTSKRNTKRAARGTSRKTPPAADAGRTALSLPVLCSLSIDDAARFFAAPELDPTQQLIAEDALKEIRGRLGFLQKCGLGYLTLDRTAPTLSGGESQRIRLAGQIGCGLVGVLYVLDEPSIGLHPRDNALLLESLEGLRDQGNTVLVVEHDEETMEAADHIIDFGPGPGVRGGEIVAQGS